MYLFSCVPLSRTQQRQQIPFICSFHPDLSALPLCVIIYIHTLTACPHIHTIGADSSLPSTCCAEGLTPSLLQCIHMQAALTVNVARCRDGDKGFKVSWSLRMLTWLQCMQTLLQAMNHDLQGLWTARLARDPSLYLTFLPVQCVWAHTQFLTIYSVDCDWWQSGTVVYLCVNNCMTLQKWQLYELSNEFTIWQCEMEKVMRDV